MSPNFNDLHICFEIGWPKGNTTIFFDVLDLVLICKNQSKEPKTCCTPGQFVVLEFPAKESVASLTAKPFWTSD